MSDQQALDALHARLREKRKALTKSDEAVNTLTELIVTAVNGDAVTEIGSKVSISDAVKAADAMRQIHATLTADVASLEQQVKAIQSAMVAAKSGERLRAMTARLLQSKQQA